MPIYASYRDTEVPWTSLQARAIPSEKEYNISTINLKYLIIK